MAAPQHWFTVVSGIVGVDRDRGSGGGHWALVNHSGGGGLHQHHPVGDLHIFMMVTVVGHSGGG